MNELISNTDLYNVLLTIKEDLGGLKSSSAAQLTAITDHTVRLGKLESNAERQKGFVKAWGLLGTAVASVLGGAVGWFFERHTH